MATKSLSAKKANRSTNNSKNLEEINLSSNNSNEIESSNNLENESTKNTSPISQKIGDIKQNPNKTTESEIENKKAKENKTTKLNIKDDKQQETNIPDSENSNLSQLVSSNNLENPPTENIFSTSSLIENNNQNLNKIVESKTENTKSKEEKVTTSKVKNAKQQETETTDLKTEINKQQKSESNTAQELSMLKLEGTKPQENDTSKLQNDTPTQINKLKLQNDKPQENDTSKLQNDTSTQINKLKLQNDKPQEDDTSKLQNDTSTQINKLKLQNDKPQEDDTSKLQNDTSTQINKLKLQNDKPQEDYSNNSKEQNLKLNSIKKSTENKVINHDSPKPQKNISGENYEFNGTNNTFEGFMPVDDMCKKYNITTEDLNNWFTKNYYTIMLNLAKCFKYNSSKGLYLANLKLKDRLIFAHITDFNKSHSVISITFNNSYKVKDFPAEIDKDNMIVIKYNSCSMYLGYLYNKLPPIVLH